MEPETLSFAWSALGAEWVIRWAWILLAGVLPAELARVFLSTRYSRKAAVVRRVAALIAVAGCLVSMPLAYDTYLVESKEVVFETRECRGEVEGTQVRVTCPGPQSYVVPIDRAQVTGTGTLALLPASGLPVGFFRKLNDAQPVNGLIPK